MAKLQVHDDRVVILPIERNKNVDKDIHIGGQNAEVTDSGILIPETGSKLLLGIIINIGKNVEEIKENDKVLILKGTGTEIMYDNKNIIIMRECDVLSTIE